MIKPSELQQIPQGNPDHRDAIEAHIDEAIRAHHKARRPWPLTIGNTRSGWSSDDIEAVLAKYRDAGWTAMSGALDTMAVLAPAPTSPKEAQHQVEQVLASAGDGEIVIGGRGHGAFKI